MQAQQQLPKILMETCVVATGEKQANMMSDINAAMECLFMNAYLSSLTYRRPIEPRPNMVQLEADSDVVDMPLCFEDGSVYCNVTMTRVWNTH